MIQSSGTPRRTSGLVHQSAWWPTVAIVIVVLAFIGLVLMLGVNGLFDFSGTAASAKIVAATLALVGGLIGSLVSIIGLVLKHSLDQRNTDIRIEAENRLKLEAAIRAVQLLSTSTGGLVPQIQRTGALFALTSLGRYELATVLTERMLAEGQIDANSASTVLDRALRSGEDYTQSEAMNICLNHVDRFLMPNGQAAFPDCILKWRTDLGLSAYVLDWGAVAMGRLLVERPLAEWEIFVANSFVVGLGIAWTKEQKNEARRNEIGAILNSILPAFPNLVGSINYSPGIIDMTKLRAEVASTTPRLGAAIQLVSQIQGWVSNASNANATRQQIVGEATT